MYKVFCGAHWPTPPSPSHHWKPEPGTPGVSPLWVALILQLAWDCYWHINLWGWPSDWLALRICDFSRCTVVQRLIPQRRSHFNKSSAIQGCLYMCQLWSYSDGALMWAKAGHCMCWAWAHLVWAMIQVEISHHLCWVWGHLVGGTVWTKDSYHLCQAWGNLENVLLQAKAICYFYWT